MRGTLTCADCGNQMQQQPQSLPQGVARCHACRAIARGLSPKRYLPHGDLYCADCGKQMWKGKTSRPQGEARCLSCRRANPPAKAGARACSGCGQLTYSAAVTPKCRACRGISPTSSRARIDKTQAGCVECGIICHGVRCRACRDVAQRIRAAGDYRVKRWVREQTAPGLSQYQRKALLARWKRQGKQCTYCPALATTIDHVLPLVRGGTNHEGNLTPCCRPCNSSKAGWTVIEWKTGKRLAPMVRALTLVRVAKAAPTCPDCGDTLRRRRCWTCKPANMGGHDGKQMTREQRASRAATAWALRQAGWAWGDVALVCEYSNGGACYNSVKLWCGSIEKQRAA